MKKLFILSALLLSTAATKAHAQDFWNTTIGRSTERDVLKTAKSQGATILESTDGDRLLLRGTFGGRRDTKLRFDFKNGIAYAGYASFEGNDATLAQTAHQYIQELTQKYGDASERTDTGEPSVESLLRQIGQGQVIRYAWRDEKAGVIRDVVCRPGGAPRAVVVGCHIIDIGAWEMLGMAD